MDGIRSDRIDLSGKEGSGIDGKGSREIPILRTLEALRKWRNDARIRGLEVGCIPTMGALHEGHLNLIKTSLSRHPLTVMTLFVNPMQFAPSEDLLSYPRTFESDLNLLQTLLHTSQSHTTTTDTFPGPDYPKTTPTSSQSLGADAGDIKESPLVIFAPTNDVMYPLRGELQDLRRYKGVTVDMKGGGDVMEGVSRPQFFTGVATICTKLFNAVEPSHAYFGQKDIQQALLLRVLLTDLLVSHPLPHNLHILPTTRDPIDHLALSSRNAYLTPPERAVAPVLYQALTAASKLWDTGTDISGEDIISTATSVIADERQRISINEQGVELRHDYIEVFDPETFEPIRSSVNVWKKKRRDMGQSTGAVIAGAVWVGRTRLIDNLLLGWEVD
ncbi:pantoate-beta-alanine ligase [Tremella mesenterica]|uniref:Pantoate--beta-alanine ligase n=1 Tax=Tremella mesenterica TaxID=5217 RepID=A0A4Q1BVM6_TREME|nr:pantoate-beta-alanine ligase [Tremella mesenterica]